MTIRNPQGFTLVELLLVILLLSGLTLVATAYVDNASQQMGFDQTKVRLEQIRRAILGDTSRTINGHPEISGFVADMGRLPENLQELVNAPADPDKLWGSTTVDLDSDPVAVFDAGELYGGWRGPYLEAMQESDGSRAFRDGWGNEGQTSDANAVDYDGKLFGWVYALRKDDDTAAAGIDEAARIFMQSLGADFAAGQADTENPYHKDYPASGNLVSEHDWRVDVSNQSIQVQINRATTTADNLQLSIYWLKNRELQSTQVSLGAATVDVGSQQLSGSFPADTYLPMGVFAAVVVCNGTSVPYDGACPSTTPPVPPTQYFKLIPRSHQPPLQIEWNTQ
jgi:prepilin-type N-terminal cleavage/methylation domain-containing protein